MQYARYELRRATQRWLYGLHRASDRWLWLPVGQFATAIHPLPLLGGLAIMLALALSGQLHEIYLSYWEAASEMSGILQLLLAALSMVLLSAALFFANAVLTDVRFNVVWAEHRDVDRESKLRLVRTISGLVAAALPWLGLGVGLYKASALMHKHIAEMQAWLSVLGNSRAPFDINLPLQLAHSLIWTLFPVAIIGSIVLLVLIGCRNNRIRIAALIVIVSFLLLEIGIPGLPDIAKGIELFRTIGAFAMIVFGAVGILAFATIVALLSRENAAPVLVLGLGIVLTVTVYGYGLSMVACWFTIVFGILTLVALLSWNWRLFLLSSIITCLAFLILRPLSSGEMVVSESNGTATLDQQYSKWLKARESQRAQYGAAGQNYPVFIIAAEGGGIYAAAAASAFLARLQDLCPNFAQHVFTISGVSGGGFGATIFQSMIQNRGLVPDKCALDGEPASTILSDKTARVIRSDHLSPILGFFVANLLNTFGDRGIGLEQGLIESIGESERFYDGKESKGAYNRSRARFTKHWSPKEAAPALVLNATSVESGYRAVFAPFDLNDVADGSLQSFSKFSDNEPTLAGAAVVSARFPGILPAYPVSYEKNRLNVVDGGYSDASGAFTALDIFNALTAREKKDDVDLRLILITSARPTSTASKAEAISALDALAPFVTLLNVRGVFWEVAVSRTTATVDPTNAGMLRKLLGPAQTGAKKWKAALVEIDEESFSLSLGWKISQSTQAIISLMMGNPKLCQLLQNSEPNNRVSVGILRANSCVMSSVVQLLDPSSK
jgi:hypothetical protein